MRKKIGECLVQAGLITEADLQTALAEHKRSGERLGAVLVRMNLATERQIAKALAYQLGFSYVNLTEHVPDPGAVTMAGANSLIMNLSGRVPDLPLRGPRCGARQRRPAERRTRFS